MFNKIGILTSVSLIAFSALTADQMDSTSAGGVYAGGWTMGPMARASSTGTDYFITAGYIDDMFLVDLGVNYEHIKLGSAKANRTEFLAHLGLRNQLYQNLYVTYGAVGGTVAGKVNGKRPYSAGAFVGFDLQFMRHFVASTKINAFNYERTDANSKHYQVFESGTVALSYVF